VSKGFVPDGWREVKLGEVAETSSGGTPSRANPKYFGGKIPWVTTSELKDNVILDSKELITVDAIANSSAKIFKSGTLLMAMYGATIGRLGILGLDASTNQACCAIFPYDELHRDYLYDWLLYKRDDIIDLGTGAGQPNISQDIIRKLKLTLPPIAEQEAIASVLNVWDDGINVLERKIALKEELKKGLMQQLLTVPSDADAPKLRTINPETGQPFEGEWKSVKLGEVAKMGSGGTPKSTEEEYYNGNIPWVSIADITKFDKYLGSTEKYLTNKGLVNSSAKVYDKNVVLYAMYASIGKCIMPTIPVSSSQAILGIVPNNERLDREYLYYLLTSSLDIALSFGQQGTQSNLSKEIVQKFKIHLPTLEEQRTISSILSTADAELHTLHSQLANLKDQKKYLLNNLVTGHIRLPEYVDSATYAHNDDSSAQNDVVTCAQNHAMVNNQIQQ
jgi:type I restriction enzyme S subunit